MAGFVFIAIRNRWLSDLNGEALSILDGQPNNVEKKAADFFVTDRGRRGCQTGMARYPSVKSGEENNPFGDWCNW